MVGFVWRKSRSIHRENIEEAAEGAREVLMPGANGWRGTEYGSLDTVANGDEERRGRRQSSGRDLSPGGH
jgi:hypothetical protein